MENNNTDLQFTGSASCWKGILAEEDVLCSRGGWTCIEGFDTRIIQQEGIDEDKR